MTLEKPLLHPVRIGAMTGERRWRLGLANVSAPAWRLRAGPPGAVDGSGRRRRRRRGTEPGAPGKGRIR